MKKVLILNPLGFYDATPCIVSIISYLKESGYEIDMISIKDTGVLDLNVNFLHLFSSNSKKISIKLGKIIFPFFLILRCFGKSYNSIIVIDNWGLIYSLLCRTKKTKLIYLVLHIFSLSSAVARKNILAFVTKMIETAAISSVDAILIQDEQRKKSFISQNKSSQSKNFFILPNTHRGSVNFKKSTFYQDLFKVSNETKFVIMAGTIEKWSFPEFLIDATNEQSKPSIYKSIIQSRQSRSEQDNYIGTLTEMSKEDVFFCLNPIDIKDLDVAISSSHIGCAFYQAETDYNHSVLGFASGKMLSYLKNGIPIIMFNSSGVSELVNKYKCGKILNTTSSKALNTAINEILGNYLEYSRNALKCYSENFDFDSHMRPIRQFIETTDFQLDE